MKTRIHPKAFRRIDLISFLFVSFFLIYSCSTWKTAGSVKNTVPTPYPINVSGFPDYTNIPEDNPMTKEGVELGRYLFYDGRLSGNSQKPLLMSCASCHKQVHSFECGMDDPKFKDGHPHGITGKLTPHSMLPLINLVWNQEGYLWNGMVNFLNMNLGAPAYGV